LVELIVGIHDIMLVIGRKIDLVSRKVVLGEREVEDPREHVGGRGAGGLGSDTELEPDNLLGMRGVGVALELVVPVVVRPCQTLPLTGRPGDRASPVRVALVVGAGAVALGLCAVLARLAFFG
jgi:hypothetical protein